MIKSLSKLLNNRIFLQKSFARFNAPKETEDLSLVDESIADIVP